VTHKFDTPMLQMQEVRARYRRGYRQQRRWQFRQETLHSQQKQDYREPDGERC
jgi:hypothetical protein